MPGVVVTSPSRGAISPVSAGSSSAAIDESPWKWPTTKDDEIDAKRLAANRLPSHVPPPSNVSLRSSGGCLNGSTPDRRSAPARRQPLARANDSRDGRLFWLGDGVEARHVIEQSPATDRIKDASSPAPATPEPRLPRSRSPDGTDAIAIPCELALAASADCQWSDRSFRLSPGVAAELRDAERSPAQNADSDADIGRASAAAAAASALRAAVRCGGLCISGGQVSEAAAALQTTPSPRSDSGAAVSSAESSASRDKRRWVRFAE